MAVYGDEEIVKLLNNHKKESTGDVYSGIIIRGDLHHFHEYHFMDEQLKIMIPLRFINMPEEVIRVKYGHLPKPNVLMCSRDYTIDIMMSFTEQELREDEIEQAIVEQITILKTIQPAYEIYEQKIEDNGYLQIGWFDYRASTMDIALYCMNFLFVINQKMVVGKFSCNIYKAEYWKPVIQQMIYSINNEARILKEKSND